MYTNARVMTIILEKGSKDKEIKNSLVHQMWFELLRKIWFYIFHDKIQKKNESFLKNLFLISVERINGISTEKMRWLESVYPRELI